MTSLNRPKHEQTVKALVVSTHFPYDFRMNTTGTYKRMRVFLDALKERASFRLLFYYPPYVRVDAASLKDTTAAIKSLWEIEDVEVVVCRQVREPDDAKRLWARYFGRATSIYRQLGFVCTSGPEQLQVFEDCLADRPDFIFAHRLNTLCPALRTRGPLPPIFMDLDDIEHKAFLRSISQPPAWATKRLYYLHVPALVLGERRAIQLARKTFVCSERDAHYLRAVWRLPNVRVVPNSIQLPERPAVSRERTLLFLGGYRYPPNAIAAEFLTTRIWSLVRAECPDARLIIAGSEPELIPSFREQHAGLEYTGFVDDLDALYARVRVACCPIQSGGGTRIKIIEAAAYGKPIVATKVGAEGLDFAEGREILLRDDPREFAKACVALLRDSALASRLGDAARAKVARTYDRRMIMLQIQQEIFGSLQGASFGA